ncbi:MAG: glycosyltransferase family 39 protein [Planctomycetes bacterium]|nr:glycosyltransferase family 39 protein [Planctomycetota bacterium]
MTASEVSIGRDRALSSTFAWAALAAIVYAMTWQDALHGTDWRWFVLWLDEAGAVHAQHPGYLVVARGLRTLLAPLGADAYGVLRVLSILGGAVTVAGIHRIAAVVNGEARAARHAAAVAIVSPALWHHATVIELHAAFAAVMVWAGLTMVHWLRTGGARWAVATGAFTGVATVMHATGHMLVPAVFATLVWRGRERGMRWVLGAAVWFAIVHTAVWGGLFATIRTCGHLPQSVLGMAAQFDATAMPANPLEYLLHWAEGMELATQFWPTTLHEWLQPFAPLSVAVLIAMFVSGTRAAALLLHLVLLVYLLATVALVHAWTDERGAYLLPFLVPGILIAMRSVPRRWWLVLFAVTVACGAAFRGEPGREPPDRAFGQAAVAMARERPTRFFVADFPEMDGAFLADPNLDLRVARKEYDDLLAIQQEVRFEPTPEQITAWLSMLHRQARQAGARFVITDRAVAWMTDRAPRFAAAWPMFLQLSGAERLAASAGIAGYAAD